jgi:hypothetical protein
MIKGMLLILSLMRKRIKAPKMEREKLRGL